MKTLRALAVCLLTAAILVLPSMRAMAQMDSREAIDLQNQIAELRQELQMMQQAQQSGNQAPPMYPSQPYPAQMAPPSPGNGGSGGNDTVAELLVRVSALEEQVRDLQGKVDDLNNQMQRQHDDLAKQLGDLEFKLGQGGGGGGAPSGDVSGAPEPVVPPAGGETPRPTMPAHRTPEMILREGNLALGRRDFAGAAAAAREVLGSAHGPRLTDAQFLLARAEGGEGQYKAAAADYFKAYQRAPKSTTGEVALLGVANSLLGLDDKKDACEALAKLSVEYPRASAEVKANANSARRRAGCAR